MKRVNGFYLYTLGDMVGAFAYAWMEPGISRAAIADEWHHMCSRMLFIESMPFTPEGFERTKKAARQVIDHLKIVEHSDRFPQLNVGPEEPIPPEHIGGINDTLEKFKKTLANDLGELPLYYIPTRFGYVSTVLLEKAGQIFGTVEKEVMEIAGPDVLEAGRCLAFERWTAFAFHFLRACELVILEYFKVCNQKCERGSWGNYTRALGQITDSTRQMKRAVERLKNWDRDEIMHPPRMLDEPEAESLLADVKAVIHDMVIDMRARRAAEKPGDA